MARLAGQFAGIARIQCPEDKVDALVEALNEAGRGSSLPAAAKYRREAVKFEHMYDAGARDPYNVQHMYARPR